MAERNSALQEARDHTWELRSKVPLYLTREAAAFMWPWEVCLLVATIEKRKTEEAWNRRDGSHD